jgi:hypothetical protein
VEKYHTSNGLYFGKGILLKSVESFYLFVECYKSIFGLNGISFVEIFEYKPSNKTIVNHKCTLYTKLPRINCYKYSFFVRVVQPWKALSSHVAEAENLATFKSQLKLHMNLF